MCSRPRRVVLLVSHRDDEVCAQQPFAVAPREVSSYEALIRIAHAPPVASRPFGLCEASRADQVCRRSREPPKEPPAAGNDHTNWQGSIDLVVMSELLTELPVPSTDGTNVDGFLNAECARASYQLIGNSPYIFDLPRTVSLNGPVPAPWRRSIGKSRE
jgi:hypothetical protein